MTKKINQDGFTLVELMIATTVFAVILVICATAMITIGRYYYKGITSSRAQEAARNVMDTVTHPIQFGAETLLLPAPVAGTAGSPDFTAVCVGDTRLTYVKDAQVDDKMADSTYNATDKTIRHALWQDVRSDLSSCKAADLTHIDPSAVPLDPTRNGSSGKELVPVNMRLSKLTITAISGTNLVGIDVGIAYGDNDLFERDGSFNITGCKLVKFGGQFCGVAQLKTTVQRRVN